MNALISRGSLFDDFFRDVAPGFYVKPLHGDPLPSAGQIRMDVKENGDAYTVSAEIPGVRKEDIHVTIEGSMVMVRAEVKQEDSQTQDDKLLRSERYFGSVSRGIQLPQDVDQGQAKAKYDNGVLMLTLPKKQGKGGQKLRIE
ncbi:Hsp20/alpha crystallin family protein [Rhodoferax sp. BAB1]|uniref:Hsp20/alpha crystallin family protein n=1 Tax=Rhodoferax sp. BAB1 TaxID=2741720 RepID=UPI0015770A2E|nr:Hsp20/alpha crystallin family protein [Rhodoferax sp. BAB1]QKO22291.1 Hsp20/alpha crystallin family protein [Rhodoferax sp. BAB1]